MRANTRVKSLRNYQREALAVLAIVQALENAYAENYLTQLLLGDHSLPVKKLHHPTLETFGALQDMKYDRVKRFITYLTEQGYLQVANPIFGTLKIADKGIKYMEEPEPIMLGSKDLRTSRYEQLLKIELTHLRKEISRETNKLVFRVYTDFTLKQIIKDKPVCLSDLTQIPGLSEEIIATYGDKILEVVQSVDEKRRKEEAASFQKKINSPSHQEVKTLFLAGLNPHEMADKRKVKVDTIYQTLVRLHHANEIDLRQWIEANIDKDILERGVGYFQDKQDSRLKPAHEQLNIDYQILRLCRLYANASLATVATSA